MIFKILCCVILLSTSLYAVELENKLFWYSLPFVDFENQGKPNSKLNQEDKVLIYDNADFKGVPKIIITSKFVQSLERKKIFLEEIRMKICDDWECDNSKNPISFLEFSTSGVSLKIIEYKNGIATLKIGDKKYYSKRLIESNHFSSRTYSNKDKNAFEYLLNDKMFTQEWDKFKSCVKQKSFECLAALKIGQKIDPNNKDFKMVNASFQKHLMKYLKLRLVLDNPKGKMKMIEHLKKINEEDLDQALDMVEKLPPELEVFVGSIDVFWDKLHKVCELDFKNIYFWYVIDIDGKVNFLSISTEQKNFVKSLGENHENVDIEIIFEKNYTDRLLFYIISPFKFGSKGRQ